jgi:hypothetical protein
VSAILVKLSLDLADQRADYRKVFVIQFAGVVVVAVGYDFFNAMQDRNAGDFDGPARNFEFQFQLPGEVCLVVQNALVREFVASLNQVCIEFPVVPAHFFDSVQGMHGVFELDSMRIKLFQMRNVAGLKTFKMLLKLIDDIRVHFTGGGPVSKEAVRTMRTASSIPNS